MKGPEFIEELENVANMLHENNVVMTRDELAHARHVAEDLWNSLCVALEEWPED